MSVNMSITSGGNSNLPSATALRIGATVMLVVTLWGLLGNILIVVVILRNHVLKSTTKSLIVSLCINDILNLGFNNTIVRVSYGMMEWKMGSVICQMLMHASIFLVGSSLWHNGLIAIHRLIVVCFNNFYKKTSKKAYIIFILSFTRINPLPFTINPYLGYMSQFQPKLIRCVIRKEFFIFLILVNVMMIILSSVILIICYVAIFIEVYLSSKVFHTIRQRVWLRREIHITKIFGKVFLLITLGHLPYNIVRSIDQKLELSADFYIDISVLYSVANSCNPIIYGVMNRTIRYYCFSALGLEHHCMATPQQESPISPKPYTGSEMPSATPALSSATGAVYHTPSVASNESFETTE